MKLRSLKAYSVFLHLLLAGLAVEVVLLLKENQTMRQSQQAAQPPRLEEGDLLEPFPFVDLDGRSTRLDFAASGEETVLLIFTTKCPYCQKNQPAWKELHREIKDRYRVLGVSIGELEPTKSYAAANGLAYPIVVPTDAGVFSKAYKIPGVPMTVHVGADGRVKKIWTGVLTEEASKVFSAGKRL